MGRIDLYTLPHKVQRVHLFALSSKLGRADFKNPNELRVIEQELRQMIHHLRDHSNNENTFIHPLYAEIGDLAEMIDEEHDDLEEGLIKLETIIDEKRWSELYSELNLFIGIYLLHQDEEERAQAEILWKHFDDQRLLVVMEAFKASRLPNNMEEELTLAVPCLSTLELTQMFGSIKAFAPKEAFQMACRIAEDNLEPERWKELSQSLV